MGGWFAALGQQAAGQAVSGGIAMGMQRLGSRYDRRMNEKLQRQQQGIQMQGEKEMMEYQQKKQLEMWEKTGYGAQVEQMKKAGINPALMYGMGGGGGQTVGAGGSPAVQGSAQYVETAPKGMGIESIAQLALLNAQRKNIEADTALKTAGIPKAGAETENIQAQTELTRIHREIAQVQASVARQTINEQMKVWEQTVEKNTAEINNLGLDAKKKNEEIALIHQQAINAVLEAGNIEAKTNLSKEETRAIGEKLLQADRQLDINDRDRQIREMVAIYQTKHPGLWNVIGGTIEAILESGRSKELPNVKPIPKK